MCNQGKKGEMVITELVSQMGQIDGSITDFERYSKTNTADNGIDICLHHTERHWDEMIEISEGNRSSFSAPSKDNSAKIETRIDVKSYSGKITKPVMEKFVSDIPKSPRIRGHLLVGGEGLTKGAEGVFKEAISNYPNRKIGYIPDSGVQKISEATKLQLTNQNNKNQDDEM